jgi:hypothetical protein
MISSRCCQCWRPRQRLSGRVACWRAVCAGFGVSSRVLPTARLRGGRPVRPCRMLSMDRGHQLITLRSHRSSVAHLVSSFTPCHLVICDSKTCTLSQVRRPIFSGAVTKQVACSFLVPFSTTGYIVLDKCTRVHVTLLHLLIDESLSATSRSPFASQTELKDGRTRA